MPHAAASAVTSSLPRLAATAVTLRCIEAKPSARAAAPRSSGSGTPNPAALPSGERSTSSSAACRGARSSSSASAIPGGPQPERRRHRAPLVGVAGQDDAPVAAGERRQRRGRVEHRPGERQERVLEVQAQIDRHLVVARAAGVDRLAEGAEPRHQRVLDRGVHVLVGGGDRQAAAPRVGKQPAQRRAQARRAPARRPARRPRERRGGRACRGCPTRAGARPTRGRRRPCRSAPARGGDRRQPTGCGS